MNTINKVGIYPGTFDPVTYGHLNIIEQAVKLFDYVICAVAESHHKNTLIPLEKRLELAHTVLKPWSTVSVEPMSGLLVDFARHHHASWIIRGLRNASDFDYESQLAGINHQMDNTLHTLFLPSLDKHPYLSSTLVREILLLGGDLSLFVPPAVTGYFHGT